MAILYEATGAGGGHIMNPAPDISLVESDVVDAVNGAQEDNDEVASLFGIQRWSNVKTFRVAITSGIGHYGVGEWQYTLVNPTAADEASWGWFQSDTLKKLGDLEKEGYDIDLKFKFDPSNGEVITLGGYILDTDNGYICIKFANYVVDTANAKVFVDVTVTRNDVEY